MPSKVRTKGADAFAAVTAYLIAACVVGATVWATVGGSAFSFTHTARVTLSAAAGPLYLVTATVTRRNEVRYDTVGPLVGGACLALWLAAVVLVPSLRRLSPAAHLLAGVAWMFCGTLLLIATSGK